MRIPEWRKSRAAIAAACVVGLCFRPIVGAEAASSAYIANTPYNVVKVIDTGTMTEAAPPITVGSFPDAVTVSPDGRRAYVINSGDHTLSVIDTASNSLVGSPIGIGFATDVAVSPDSQTIYVTSSEQVLVIS